jgi:hypothetical protein
MIEFAASHIRPRFLLKCDDDSFVRLGSILEELPKKGGESFLYWGYFDGRAPVITKVCYGRSPIITKAVMDVPLSSLRFVMDVPLSSLRFDIVFLKYLKFAFMPKLEIAFMPK